MDLMVLNSNYDAIAVVDAFKSVVWAVRYNSVGDFELEVPATLDNVDLFRLNRYLWRRDSDRLMIIDSIEIGTDVDDAPLLTVSGESLESILKRRIVAGSAPIKGNLQNEIKKLLDENIITPSEAGRAIPNFVFLESSDPYITGLTVNELYFQGETVYDAIEQLCGEAKIGFKVTPHGAGGFAFQLYVGVDRSFDQEVNPYVIFSPEFENLLGSRYISTYANYKNVCYSVGTWDEGTDRVEHKVNQWVSRSSSLPSGLARREIFLDNGGFSLEEDESESNNNQSHWDSVAVNEGKNELLEYETTTAIDGELQGNLQWEYGKDYFIGDKVQVVNEFGMQAVSYISEIVFSSDDAGDQVVPTFTSTDNNADKIM